MFTKNCWVEGEVKARQTPIGIADEKHDEYLFACHYLGALDFRW